MSLKGLSKKAVEESRKRYGTNALTQIPPEPLWKKILEGFKDPMPYSPVYFRLLRQLRWLS